jgi:hypothetical protein
MMENIFLNEFDWFRIYTVGLNIRIIGCLKSPSDRARPEEEGDSTKVSHLSPWWQVWKTKSANV